MNTYSVYGLTVRSEFDLPELRAVEENAQADAVFQRGEVDPVPKRVDGKGGRRIEAQPERCRLTYESFGSFLVENGYRVTFDPRSPDVVTTKIVRRLFENEMLGVLMHQLGRIVLHASAVVIDGSVVAFVGPRGVGKSTTAAAFYAEGHPIMEDDIVSIRIEDGIPIVDPGVPELRINSDIVNALGFSETQTYARDGKSSKEYYKTNTIPSSAPLQVCYVLSPGDTCSVSLLPEREQFFRLIGATYTQGMLNDTSKADSHFKSCREIVAETRFRSLTRQDSLSDISTLVETVRADLQS